MFESTPSDTLNLGLKKPITVTYDEGKNGHTIYYLACGQDRLEAAVSSGDQQEK